jgi:hypothetical protein
MLWPILYSTAHTVPRHGITFIPYAEVYSAIRHRHRLSSHTCRTGDLLMCHFLSLSASAWLILRITVYPGIVYVQVQLYGNVGSTH